MTDAKTTKKKPANGRKRKRKSPAKKPAKAKAKTKKGFDEAKFLKDYPHVVAGSIKDAKVGSTVGGLKIIHPRICQIKCKESGKLRTVHTQDAWQVKYTVKVQAQKARERAAARRKEKKKKSTKKAG